MVGSTPLFWRERYWEGDDRAQSLTKSLGSSMAKIFFRINGSVVEVPGRATFGGWYPTGSSKLTDTHYVELYRGLLEESASSTLVVRLPPKYFLPEFFLPQVEALRQLPGVEVTDVNFSIYLNDDSGNHSFSRGNRKRVRQFAEAAGRIRECLDPERNAAYDLLRNNRSRRSAQLSMSRASFLAVLSDNPDHYRCWLAHVGGEILGVALTVQISEETLYVLYWGDSVAGRQMSVVASICGFLIRLAKDEGSRFLDLGISSVEGVVDDGLKRFKENLGAFASPQPTFELAAGSGSKPTKISNPQFPALDRNS